MVLLRQVRVDKHQLVEIKHAWVARNQVQPPAVRDQAVLLLGPPIGALLLLRPLRLRCTLVPVRHTVQVGEDEEQQLAQDGRALQPHLEQAVTDHVSGQERMRQAFGKPLHVLRRDVAAVRVPALELLRVEQLLDFHVGRDDAFYILKDNEMLQMNLRNCLKSAIHK